MTANRLVTSLLTLACAAALANAQALPESFLAALEFRAIGPSVTGGRIVDLAVHPRRAATYWIASASGGLFKTENSGTTWKPVFDDQGTISIGAVAVAPSAPDEIWVGTGEANNQRSSLYGDGIYKSSDGGATWSRTGLEDSGHIARIVVQPTDAKIVYVAVMGHQYGESPQRGLFKTIDGGVTWTHALDLGPAVGVTDVALDPNQPDTVVAASYERLRRPWHFDGTGPGTGIHRSRDGGATWQRLGGGLPEGEIDRIGIAFAPSAPGTLYAIVPNLNRAAAAEAEAEADAEGDEGPREEKVPEDADNEVRFAGNVRFSQTDGMWTVTARPRRGVAVELGDVLLRFAGVEPGEPDHLRELIGRLKPGDRVVVRIRRADEEKEVRITLPERTRSVIGGQVYRSTDGGDTFSLCNEKPVGGDPPYYYGQIRVDPNDAERVYVLGVPLFASSDGGATFNDDIGDGIHVDHHALWIDPSDSSHLILGNDGGVHVSWDRGENWDHVFNLPLPQFYAVSIDMQRPYHVYGGTQDNGSWGGPSRSRNGNGVGRFDWYSVGGGDGFHVQVPFDDPAVIISESQFGGLRRLDRNTGRSVGIRPPQSEADGPPDRYNWSSPALLSSHDSRVLYFCGQRVFKSFNRGDDWLTISPDLTTRDPMKIAGNVPHCTITTFAESPLDKNLLMAGTDDGKVWITDDGGKNWRDLSERFPVLRSGWWCTRVELSRRDRRTAYVAFSRLRDDDFRPFLFLTRDAGGTFEPITGDLPADAPVNVVREDPRRSSLLWVGTDLGVFCSLDDGRHWNRLTQGLPTNSVHDLVVHPRDRDLVVGTHGRGLFILDATPLQEVGPEHLEADVHLFGAEDAVVFAPRPSASRISGQRRFIAADPADASFWLWTKEAASEDGPQRRLRILDANDERMTELSIPKSAGLHRIEWDLRKRERAPDGRGRGRRGRRGGGPRVPAGRYQAVYEAGELKQQVEFAVIELDD